MHEFILGKLIEASLGPFLGVQNSWTFIDELIPQSLMPLTERGAMNFEYARESFHSRPFRSVKPSWNAVKRLQNFKVRVVATSPLVSGLLARVVLYGPPRVAGGENALQL